MMGIANQNYAHEDYIDIEVGSSTNLLCSSSGSPPHHREFEFQMGSMSQDTESTTSPADELFYKGKLLPLHLPPRLEMVQKLLQVSNAAALENKAEETMEENHANPFRCRSTISSIALSTPSPSDSDDISPSESCRVSTELNLDERLLGWTNEKGNIIICDYPKKSWSKKLKQSSLGRKLKASRAYFKSFFIKSGCSGESSAKADCNMDTQMLSKNQEPSRKCVNVEKIDTFFPQIDDRFQGLSTSWMKSIDREFTEDNANSITHRRSFSGVIQRHSAQKSSSSPSSSVSSSSSFSFSFPLQGFCDLQLLKRSSGASSVIDTSIQEAIAHCKQSQQLLRSRSPPKKITQCPFSTPRIAACVDQERAGLCRM